MAYGKVKRVPWARLEQAQEEYIENEYLPSGIRLRQFHHMRADVINALLQHWSERQAAGKIPFRFQNFGRIRPRAMQTDSANISEGSPQGGEARAHGGASDDPGEAAQNYSTPTAPVSKDVLSEGHENAAENVSGIFWLMIL